MKRKRRHGSVTVSNCSQYAAWQVAWKSSKVLRVGHSTSPRTRVVTLNTSIFEILKALDDHGSNRAEKTLVPIRKDRRSTLRTRAALPRAKDLL